MTIRRPAVRPCESCPYRRDVPSGIWAAEEYHTLPGFDQETASQPLGAFMCHQSNGRLCAGWVGCHDVDNLLGLRIVQRWMSPADVEATYGYESPVPLFDSGAQAAEHGLAEVDNPGSRALRMIRKITRRRSHR